MECGLREPQDLREYERCCVQVVVAFRGTESLTDARTDAAATLRTIIPDEKNGGLKTWNDAGPNAKRGLNLGPFTCFFRRAIHFGFYRAYRCVVMSMHAPCMCYTEKGSWDEPGMKQVNT